MNPKTTSHFRRRDLPFEKADRFHSTFLQFCLIDGATKHFANITFPSRKSLYFARLNKVIGGVGRQLDILAVNMISGEQFHIESSVTHKKNWAPKEEALQDVFEKKFLGVPPKREGKKTDHARGKRYLKDINATYLSYGLDPKKIQRVFVCWILHPKSPPDNLLKRLENEHQLKVSIVSFRDEVLPVLRDSVGSANYDDEILRTLSFVKERSLQLKIKE